MAKYIASHADDFAKALQETLRADSWKPKPNKETAIQDRFKGKIRHLKIPCLFDQSVELAWLNIAEPYMTRKLYHYCCGSIPGAGQQRAVNGLKSKLRIGRKYGVATDIKAFYDSIPHELVMHGLRRIFKDEHFLMYAGMMLANMSDTEVGLAIGHPISHWFANVATMEIVNSATEKFPKIFFVQYMDDIGAVGNNKRELRRFVEYIRQRLFECGLKIKPTWQIIKIDAVGLTFLSYRFFNRYTLLTKPLLFRIARRAKATHRNYSLLNARAMVSYWGVLKHCNSHNFKKDRVFPFVSIRKCRRIISNDAKNRIKHQT